MLVVGRIINGSLRRYLLGRSSSSTSRSLLLQQRGRLVGFQQWAITWGILIMFFICYGSSFINGSAAFRLPWGLQMIPAILLGFGLIFLPDRPAGSPRRIAGGGPRASSSSSTEEGDNDSPWVARELGEIRDVVEFERRQLGCVTYLELFKPHMINRTDIGLHPDLEPGVVLQRPPPPFS